eukprot:gb/GECG01000006.1/.p1 GENE.gb/GECG01000006.1/~~gb/GECG01000006.1/.p1  ORF type:complete len:615 (+),score=134.52 gb/GECG01000006.1/:1-1845(+)
MPVFDKTYLAGPVPTVGSLEVDDEGLHWTANEENGKRVNLPYSSITSAKWASYPAGLSQVWVETSDGELTRFFGVRSSDKAALSEQLQKLGVTLQDMEPSIKGGNWGTYEFQGKNLIWKDENDQPTFVVSLRNLASAVGPGKNDVELQFTEEDTAEKADEVLVDMRFHVPEQHEYAEHAEEEVQQREEEESKKPELERTEIEQRTPAEWFRHQVIAKADLRSVTGEMLAELDENVGMFLIPRGRYALEFYGSMLRLVGKTYEFKISYNNIARVYYLPRPNPSSTEVERYNIVISLQDPVKYGQQRYPHLVMQLDNREYTCPLHIPEDERKKHYPQLGEEISDDLPKVVATLFKHLTNTKVFRPGKFESALKHKAVRCTLKGNEGLLYPLDKSFFFIHKPATFIRYDEVAEAQFKRVSSGAGSAAMHTFDLHVRCKNIGGQPGREHTFHGIDMREKGIMYDFLKERVKVSEEKDEMDDRRNIADVLAEEDAEDQLEMGDEEEGDEGAKKSKQKGEAGDEDDDEEEEDSDFQEEGTDSGGSGNESSDDEDDEGGSDDNDDDDEDEADEDENEAAKKNSEEGVEAVQEKRTRRGRNFRTAEEKEEKRGMRVAKRSFT